MIGRTLGRYRILEKLGEGGMGQVWQRGWKAADTRLPRSVALKLLRESLLTSTDARRRFLREATAACKLDHPAIAAVHDADEADGQVLIAYQFVDGETIADRMARSPLPIAEAVALARQAAEGLAHAHANGVLHRDISSRNLMVTKDGRLKIVDFGLAQVEELSRVTSSNTLVGTAGYIAPEVIKSQQWSERSDVYALGVVLYEMLAGRLPFEGPLEAQVYAKMHSDPNPPSDHRAEVPRELDRLVLLALERESEDRLPSAEALVRELATLETSGALPATEEGATVRAARAETTTGSGPAILRRLPRIWRAITARRNRTAVVTAVAATLIIVVFAANALKITQGWFGSAPSRIRSVAVLPFVNESEDPGENDYRVLGLGKILNNRLFELSDLRVSSWITTRRYQGLEKPLPEIASELGVDALVVGTFKEDNENTEVNLAIVDRSGFQSWTGTFNAPADDLIGLAADIAFGVGIAVKGELSPAERDAMDVPAKGDQDAWDLYMQGAYALDEEDQTATDNALAYFSRAVQLEPELAEVHVGIGAAHLKRYYHGWAGGYASLTDAESHFLQALRYEPESIAARRGLAGVYVEKGVSEKSLQVGSQIVPRSAQDVEAILARGLAYMYGGLPKKGVPLLQRATELDPANEGALWWLTSCQVWAGQYRAATTSGESFFRSFGDEPEMRLWVGLSYHNLGVLDTARIHYERALRLFGSESNHYGLLWVGACLEQSGEPDSARAVWARAKRAVEQHLASYPDNTRMQGTLAAFQAYLGEREQFLATVNDMVSNEAVLGIATPSRPALLASGYARLGDIKGAASILRAMPDNDHAEWFVFEGWWRALGAPELFDHPDFAETREYLAERYRQLERRY